MRRLREPLERAERGPLLETYVLHELRAFINDAGCGGELGYWRTPAGSEVDFVWHRGGQRVAIEVKATSRWRPEDATALRDFADRFPKTRALAVYLGERALRDGSVEVLPLDAFVRRLSRGEVLVP